VIYLFDKAIFLILDLVDQLSRVLMVMLTMKTKCALNATLNILDKTPLSDLASRRCQSTAC
jgi:hypothetical protein